MKKLLTILGSISLTATTGSAVVACTTNEVSGTIDISDVNVTLAAGQSQTNAKKSIYKQIIKKAPTAVINVDYTVAFKASTSSTTNLEDGVNLVAGNVAVVTANTASTLLIGGSTFTTTVGSEPIQLKAADLQATIGEIKDKSNLNAVNSELDKYEPSREKSTQVEGIETLTAALKTGSTTDVTVTVVIASGYEIDTPTFDLVGAIKASPNQVELKATEIQAAVSSIKDLASIDAVNTELVKYATGGTNAITGVKTLSAIVKTGSTTDVTVTITPETGYTVDTPTFDLVGAIKTN